MENNPVVTTEAPKKRRGPCCVCKATKTLRDQCIINNGEENCKSFIDAHKVCLTENGFKV